MNKSKAIKWIVLTAVLVLTSIHAVLVKQQRDTLPLGLSDLPVILPPYYSFAASHRISGTMEFRLEFKDGRVVAVDLAAQDLQSEAAYGSDDPVISLTILTIKQVVRKWKAFLGGSYSTSLVIELQPDPAMAKDEIHYEVQYNDKGIISRIKIRGATERTVLG